MCRVRLSGMGLCEVYEESFGFNGGGKIVGVGTTDC